MNFTMVFTWVNYLKSWECKLIDHKTKKNYWGYSDSSFGALEQAVHDFNSYNHNEPKITI